MTAFVEDLRRFLRSREDLITGLHNCSCNWHHLRLLVNNLPEQVQGGGPKHTGSLCLAFEAHSTVREVNCTTLEAVPVLVFSAGVVDIATTPFEEDIHSDVFRVGTTGVLERERYVGMMLFHKALCIRASFKLDDRKAATGAVVSESDDFDLVGRRVWILCDEVKTVENLQEFGR